MRFMSIEAGYVAIAAPITQPVTGSVAKALLLASAYPARPLMAMTVELLARSRACAVARTATFFFADFMLGAAEVTGNLALEGSSGDYRA